MRTTTAIQDITALLEHLIKFPTISSDQATNRAALDWVEQQLAGLPLHIRRPEHGGFSSLIATTRDTKHPKLWLSGHIDVVPGAPGTFEPHIQDGRIYGRGAHDMKFAIACFIALLKGLGPELANYDLGLMITSDEEVGGEDGVRWLLEHQGYGGDVVINPDTGGSWELEIGSKGVMWWDLTAEGTSAHASRPWEGVSAIDRLLSFIEQLRAHLKTEPCGDRDHWHTTINIGTIQGGTVANQVSDSAAARLDVRITPGTSTNDIAAWMQAAVATVPGVKAKAILSYAPWTIHNREPIKLFKKLAQEVAGVDMSENISHAASDARHFAARGIPAVTPSPLGSGYHVPDEWVELESLQPFYEILRQFVSELAET